MAADAFAKRYWALQVQIPGGAPVTVSCNKYFIAPYQGATGDWVEAAKQKQTRIQTVQQKAAAKKLSVNSRSFLRATLGKGTPEDLEHVLSMAAQTGVASTDLQNWADNNFGVDCTGFVVAYFASLGLMDIDTYAGGASCAVFYSAAQRHDASNFIIWDIKDVQVDDVVVWMFQNGQETKKPGHISVVCNAVGGALDCAESSGESDGNGHSGPRLKNRLWPKETGSGAQRCLQMGSGAIVIRPFSARARAAAAAVMSGFASIMWAPTL